MKKFVSGLVLIFVLCMALSPMAYADDSSAKLNYVTDDAALLSSEQYQQLNTYAAELSEEYGCSVYIITLNDYTDIVNGSVYDCATAIFDYYELGWGSDKNGVLLLLSMEERDYSLIAHGSTGNSAFTDYGKDYLSDKFLDDFRENDWYGGFVDYLETAGYMLEQNRMGSPVDISGAYSEGSGKLSPIAAIGFILLLPCAVALIVCSIFRAQMKTAKLKTTAQDYVENGGIELRVRQDLFLHRTQTRQVIQKPKSGGGGTTIGRGGFSGKSGKF